MSSEIETLLAAEKLLTSLPIGSATSLYKTFQSLFLIECPNDDASALQDIQLAAAFLEYLSTQRAPKIKQLLQAWHAQKRSSSADVKEDEEVTVDQVTDMEILDEMETFIEKGVNHVCVCFADQEVQALVKMGEVRRKVEGILDRGTSSWFLPKIICQPREVV